MVELSRLRKDQKPKGHQYRQEAHCHLCGERFANHDSYSSLKATEIYNLEEGKVNKEFETHWHVECSHELQGNYH